MKFGDRRVARLQHLDVRLRGDRLERVGIDAIEKCVHRLRARSRSCRLRDPRLPVRPASARWNACECRFGIPATMGPDTRSAPSACAFVLTRSIRPSAAISIRTSSAQPVGQQCSRGKQFQDTGSITATSAAAPADNGLIASVAPTASPSSSNTTVSSCATETGGWPGTRHSTAPAVTWQSAPARGRDAHRCVANDDHLPLRAASAQHQVEIADRSVDERARDEIVAAERVRLERRAQLDHVAVVREPHDPPRKSAP